MPRRIDDYRGLTQISRVRLLHAIQREPGRRLQELAESAGIHVNTARDHLRVLEDEGLITSAPEATGTRGRPPTVYTPVTDVGENQVARTRAAHAQELGDKLRKFAPDLAHASELDDDALHQIDTLYTHLEDVGMEPEIDEGALTIDLEPCPFAGMIESERNVVCSVHATLVQHHLEQVSGPLQLGQLSPFATPEICRIALRYKQDLDLLPTRLAGGEAGGLVDSDAGGLVDSDAGGLVDSDAGTGAGAGTRQTAGCTAADVTAAIDVAAAAATAINAPSGDSTRDVSEGHAVSARHDGAATRQLPEKPPVAPAAFPPAQPSS